MLSGVSATALLTLKARAEEHAKKQRLFADPWAAEWIAGVEVPPALAKKYTQWIQVKTALRVAELDTLIRSVDPEVVIELGAGLSSRWQRLGLAGAWIDLDLPEVIAIREQVGRFGDGHRHVAASVLDRGWIDLLDPARAAKTVIVAEGLWYYLPKAEVEGLFVELRRRLPGAVMIFDVVGMLDFEASVVHSRSIGAPILWAIDPPFARAQDRLGLDVIPGLEPDAVLDAAIARAPVPHRWMFAFGAKVRAFRDRRSGTMIGRLRPL
jgi:O-methyltransferase involved in polyketide biosynthesis